MQSDSRRSPVVLIIDDNEDTADMYALGLSQAGFEPLIARDGFDGLKIACEMTPDAVVTDVVLHGPMDGLTLTRRLRYEERTCRTPIIVVTGRVSEGDRNEANRAGCDMFLAKPCPPDELATQVRRILSIRPRLKVG
jgi:two-component system, cell cycle response regulator DivK